MEERPVEITRSLRSMTSASRYMGADKVSARTTAVNSHLLPAGAAGNKTCPHIWKLSGRRNSTFPFGPSSTILSLKICSGCLPFSVKAVSGSQTNKARLLNRKSQFSRDDKSRLKARFHVWAETMFPPHVKHVAIIKIFKYRIYYHLYTYYIKSPYLLFAKTATAEKAILILVKKTAFLKKPSCKYKTHYSNMQISEGESRATASKMGVK